MFGNFKTFVRIFLILLYKCYMDSISGGGHVLIPPGPLLYFI